MVIMDTRQKIKLITRLRDNKVPQNKIDQLFTLTEKELNRIYNISNSDLFASEITKILNDNEEKYSFYLDDLKQFKNKFSKNDYEDAIEIIKSCNQQFNARCAYIAIRNELLQQYGLNIISARLISMAKKEITAEYALKVVNISKLIELGIAIPMAKLIIGTSDKDECLNTIREVLKDENNLKEVTAIIDKVTFHLRRNLITVPGHEEAATELLNVFGEILNKPLISIYPKKTKKRIRNKFSKSNN